MAIFTNTLSSLQIKIWEGIFYGKFNPFSSSSVGAFSFISFSFSISKNENPILFKKIYNLLILFFEKKLPKNYNFWNKYITFSIKCNY